MCGMHVCVCACTINTFIELAQLVCLIAGEPNEVDHRRYLVGVTSLFILHFQVFRTVDKRVFRSLWDLYKKVPCVHLIGGVVWFGNEFLVTRLPHVTQLLDRKAQLAIQQQQVLWLQTRNQNLIR